ncbi:car [Symbiodinium sp. CCMP2592]|nr:car [Symbiodinium sp. CCMP2592]
MMALRRFSSHNSEVGHLPRPGFAHSSSQLVTKLDPTLLKSVSLSECVRGFGKYLDSTRSVDKKLSRPGEKFDAFISHDWGTSRWLKLGCLLILFNTRAAVVGTVLASTILGVLCSLEVLPTNDFVVMAGHAVFLFLMCFWQSIRDICNASPRVFLDKLCISQEDPEEKKLGILGLGAFLKASGKLVILWSPRYFHRLWCTYEIVTFLRLHGEAARIQIMPAKMAWLLALTALMWQSVLFTGRFLIDSVGDPVWFPVSFAMVLLEVLGLLPLYNYHGLEIFADIEELPSQLRQFRLQQAQCTCCSIGHRHPDTGERIECDRQLVLSTLQQWHSESQEPEDPSYAFLESFNSLVQNQLSLHGNVGGDMLLLADYAIFALGANAPWMISKIPVIVNGPSEPLAGLALFSWTLKQLLDHLMLYMLTFTFMRVTMFMWKYVAPILVFESRRNSAVVLVVPQLVLGAVAWAPWWFLLQQLSEESLVPLLAFLQLLIVDVLLLFGFRPSVTSQVPGDGPSTRGTELGREVEAELGREETARSDLDFMGVQSSLSCPEEDVRWSRSDDFFSI